MQATGLEPVFLPWESKIIPLDQACLVVFILANSSQYVLKGSECEYMRFQPAFLPACLPATSGCRGMAKTSPRHAPTARRKSATRAAQRT